MSGKSEETKMRAALQSPFGVVVDTLFIIYKLVSELGVDLKEWSVLSGEKGIDACRTIADFIRDTIRGVKYDLSVAAIELAQKLGVIEEVTDIPAPAGGKVFRVLVMVDWAKAWRDYMLASCPHTDKSWDVLNVGDQFESPQRDSEIKEVIFLWFGKNVYGTVEKADAWAIENNLVASHGRIPAAVIGGIPGIIGQLQNLGYPYGSVGVVSTSQCKLDGDPRVPCAWRDGDGRRRAGLGHLSRGWDGSYVVAFFRK